MQLRNYFQYDAPAAVVVFLIALPLCLGIALASGAPLFSGIVAGIIGGIVVGSISGSPLSVSGPAAGLTSIVLASIQDLGNAFDAFLPALVLAGMMQILFGLLRGGTVGYFFPASVIKGMLAAIGLILILKQIPHALGYDADFEGDEAFEQPDGANTFTEILRAVRFPTAGAILVSLVTVAILLLWENPRWRKPSFLQRLPGPLLAVVAATLLNQAWGLWVPSLFVADPAHRVMVPEVGDGLSSFLILPDFRQWTNPRIYEIAFTMAVVASVETLLSIEACDKLDPFRRVTPLNRELVAQGIGNTLSGCIGGLPVTSVIVRSSANVHAGARTKASAIGHGVILLVAVLMIPRVLELIPLASLAGVLIVIGYKLTKPALFRQMWSRGWPQFVPFVATIVAVLVTDLLRGVLLGIAIALFFILRSNFKRAVAMIHDGNLYLIKFDQEVTFLNKSTVRQMLAAIPPHARVVIDGSESRFIDQDVLDIIEDFVQAARARQQEVELRRI